MFTRLNMNDNNGKVGLGKKETFKVQGDFICKITHFICKIIFKNYFGFSSFAD